MCDMFTEKLKELASARAKLASLEQSIAAEISGELASLPAKYGFASATDFVAAVQAATGSGPLRRGRKPGRARAGAGSTKRRTRATITDETRAQVKKLVVDGKTGGEIAKALGISLPSVQNIKKVLGLVKKRK